MAAEWTVAPSAQVLALMESNPRLAIGDGAEARSAAADLMLKLDGRTELLEMALNARGTLRRYTRDVSLDRDEQQLDVSINRRGEKVLLSMNLSAARDTTLTSELGTTGIVADNQRHESLSAALAPAFQVTERTTVGGTAQWQGSRYARTLSSPLVNYDYSLLGVNASHDTSERSSLGISASAGRLASDGPMKNIDSIDARLQADYRWSAKWRASASAGLSRVQTEGRNQNGSVFSAKMHRDAERYNFDAILSRSVAPTGRGLLSRRDEAGVHLTARLLEHLDGGVVVSRIRSRDYVPLFGFSINDVRYTSAQLSLNWQVTREWTLGLGGGRYEQQLLSNELSGHNFSASLIVAWRHLTPAG